ncbi:MAG: 4-hydroxythreonine-4-phosphate dehydrogenase PdxA [Hyphomicrobiales bacterium]
MINNEKVNNEKKINVGITHGDFNGISYEIILKTVADIRTLDLYTPVIYGSSKVASFIRKKFQLGDLNLNIIKSSDQISQKRPNLINCCTEKEYKIELGTSSSQAGQAAFEALETSIEDLKQQNIDVVVTGPINKKNIQSDQFHFPGHTEYFAEKFDAPEHLMLMVRDKLRIGVVTGHIPLRDVSDALNEDLILKKINQMHDSLCRDFGIDKPKIAILGLNPHSGDDGLLGKEEQEIIIPTIDKAREGSKLIYGPFPADGFFGSGDFKYYDGILAMYHDQGLIPFKAIAAGAGVNFTAGLPIVRTSPAHGTAYSIANKNQASAESLQEAIYLAIDIFKNREEYDERNKKPLPYHLLEEMARAEHKDEDLPEDLEGDNLLSTL